MRIRPIQLVCLALVLSTLSLADTSALAPANYLEVFLHDYVRVWTGSVHQTAKVVRRTVGVYTRTYTQIARTTARFLTASSRAAVQTPWAMRPPSAQCAALQSVTGFGRRTA